jgi:Bacterial membrane protein YfhO
MTRVAVLARLRAVPFTVWAVVTIGPVTGFAYWRVMLGRVPLPMDDIVNFPGWEGFAHRIPVQAHQEMGDLVTQDYPWRVWSAGRLRSGHVPLWNTHQLFGSPWLANLQSSLFSPLAAPAYLLPAATAWSVTFTLQLVIAGVGMAVLCRRLGAAPGPALIAGMAYGGGGFVRAWNGWPQGDAACWIPIALLAVLALRRRPDLLRIAAVAASVAAVIVAGHPQTATYAALLLVGFAAVILLAPPADGVEPVGARSRYLAGLAVGGILALGLSAVVVLPGAQWVDRLHRSTSTVLAYHFLPREVVALVSRDLHHTPNDAGVIPPEGAAYVGMLTIGAAAMGFLHRRRAVVGFFTATAVIALMVLFAVNPAFWVVNHLPVLKALPNLRAWLFVDVSLPILAALGLTAAVEHVGQVDGRRLRAWTPWMAWAVGSVVLFALSLLLIRETGGLDRLGRDGAWHGPASSLALIGASVILLCPAVVRRLGAQRLQMAACLLVAVDLASYAHGSIPMVTKATVFSRPAVLADLRRFDPGTYRIMSLDTSMPPNIDLLFGFDDAAGYDYLTEDKARFLDGLGNIAVGFDADSADIVGAHDRRVDLLNVRYLIATDYNRSAATLAAHPERFRRVLTDGHLDVFENLRALPRQWLVAAGNARPVQSLTVALAAVRSPSFDPQREVTITSDTPRRSFPTGVSQAAAGEVTAATDGEESVTASVDTPVAAVLVISQYFYPGWQATVDGHAAPVEQTDAVLQGVTVPAGSHRVVLRFLPPVYRHGRDLSMFSLVVLLVVAGVGARRAWTRRGSRP